MFNKTISDSIYKKYMPLYHQISRQIYAIPLSIYDEIRRKSGGQNLNHESPNLNVKCYLVNTAGNDIVKNSKVEIPVKELQAIGNSKWGPTLTDL